MATATKLVQVPHREVELRMCERHFSPAELGELWNLSADTVRRMFESEPGVLVFENPVRSSSRRFRTLRIPESVAERLYSRFSNCTLAMGSRIRP
jgi:hypothetical protein